MHYNHSQCVGFMCMVARAIVIYLGIIVPISYLTSVSLRLNIKNI